MLGIIGVVLLILFIIDSVLLILLVLAQNEQGDSMGGLFAGSSQTTFGSRSANILVKITTWLAVIFFAGALGIAAISKPNVPEVEKAVPVQLGEDSEIRYSDPSEAPSSPTPDAGVSVGPQGE
jgi:preprotein translocase subunit SecG